MFFNLDQITNDEGKLAILAMDQRGTLRSMLDKVGMPSSDDDLSSFKVDVVRALSPRSSGVLLDVEYGVGAVGQAGALAPGAGLLISSERSPQPTWNGEYRTEFSPDRGPAFVEAAGGVALKFLLRWRPDRPAREGEPDLAQEALDTVRAVVDACRQHGMPSVIEPLVAALPDEGPLTAEQKRQLVVRSAELLSPVGPDLLKLEWPGDDDGCLEITRVCGSVPWALLSAGIDYEKFVERVVSAMDAGASGFIAGRALWGEAVGLSGAERSHFLKTIAVERMARLAEATAGRGRSWREVTRA